MLYLVKWGKNLTKALILLFLASYTHAEDNSTLGFDYLEITKHPLLAEIMLEFEPKLVDLYKAKGLSKKVIYRGVRGVARTLRDDQMYKPMLADLESISRPTLLKLAGLPKGEYPKLHGVVKLVRLNIKYKETYGVELTEEEHESNMRLYKALHGREFGEK